MKLDSKKVRLISTMTPGVFVRGLRFVGRDSTVQLQETALVVEGNLLKVGLLGIELVYRKVLAEWSSVTIPYSQITRVRYIRFPTLRGLALLYLTIWPIFLGVMFAGGNQTGTMIGISMGLLPALIAIVMIAFIRPRYSIDFLPKDGKRTQLQLAISGRKLRNEFAKKLKNYRAAAKKFGHARVKRKRTGPGVGIVAGLTSLLLLTASALVFLGWKYILPSINNVATGMSEGNQPVNVPSGPPRLPVRVAPSSNTPVAGGTILRFNFEPLGDDEDADPVQLKHPHYVSSLAWLADGQLATACLDGAVRIWDLRTGRGTTYTLAENWKPTLLALAPDPTATAKVRAFFVAGSNTIHLWSVGQIDRPQELVRPSAVAINGALAGNEQMLAISGGNTIDVWDIKSKTFVNRTASEGAIFGMLKFTHSGDKLLAIDAIANKLLVWPVGDKSAMQMSGYSAAVFSPDSKTIAVHTVGKPSFTRLLDPGSGNTIRELNFSSGVGPLAFSPNGRVLASGFSDEKFVGVGFWDATSGLLLGRVSGGNISIGQSAFRTDGTVLATIESQEVKVWRTPRFVEFIARSNPLTHKVPEEGPTPRVQREQAPPPRIVRP